MRKVVTFLKSTMKITISQKKKKWLSKLGREKREKNLSKLGIHKSKFRDVKLVNGSINE